MMTSGKASCNAAREMNNLQEGSEKLHGERNSTKRVVDGEREVLERLVTHSK